MILTPKRIKFRKQIIKGKKGVSTRGNDLSFGEYGLKSLEKGFITARQIEAARKAITGVTKRGGKMWITIFPNLPITKKPLEVRMGKGVGSIDHYSVYVKPGRILFEVSGVEKSLVMNAFKQAAIKLSLKVKIVNNIEEIQ